MFRQSLSGLLVGSLVFTLFCAPSASAKSKAEKEAQRTEKVKAGVARLGVGNEARVTVKLRGGRRLAGYVKEAGEGSFVIADLKTGVTTAVSYPDVTQVKGHHLSKGAKIAIIALSIGVGVLAFSCGWKTPTDPYAKPIRSSILIGTHLRYHSAQEMASAIVIARPAAHAAARASLLNPVRIAARPRS